MLVLLVLANIAVAVTYFYLGHQTLMGSFLPVTADASLLRADSTSAARLDSRSFRRGMRPSTTISVLLTP